MLGCKPHDLFVWEEAMNNLRNIRVVKRVTQFQLRLLSGIHQSRISLIENGLIEPRQDEKQRLSKALQVEPEKIWKNETDSEKGK
jgi:transcriptional regulator with XRE-family HTH domain